MTKDNYDPEIEYLKGQRDFDNAIQWFGGALLLIFVVCMGVFGICVIFDVN